MPMTSLPAASAQRNCGHGRLIFRYVVDRREMRIWLYDIVPSDSQGVYIFEVEVDNFTT